jgi:3-oxo-5-alpha-steroid 4-dehydrogenase 1
MTELQFYYTVLYVFLGFALVSFISLLFMPAPYGRHARTGWGPLVPNKPAWLIMEAPASILFFVYFIFAGRSMTITLVVLLVIWQIHYFHRSFIFPFMLKSDEKVPLSIMIFSMIFNSINTYIQGRWLYAFSPESSYTASWIWDPRFIIGVLIFACGFVMNKHADAILRGLWDRSNPGYKIPYGGMYRFISCPNYFGEIVTWIGWAFMTWSLAGLFFVVWTAANLVPRAMVNHKWYLEKFPAYPKERKAIIPFLF